MYNCTFIIFLCLHNYDVDTCTMYECSGAKIYMQNTRNASFDVASKCQRKVQSLLQVQFDCLVHNFIFPLLVVDQILIRHCSVGPTFNSSTQSCYFHFVSFMLNFKISCCCCFRFHKIAYFHGFLCPIAGNLFQNTMHFIFDFLGQIFNIWRSHIVKNPKAMHRT